MAFQINRQDDKRSPVALVHRLGDIPGGVLVDSETLTGAYIEEGTPIGKNKKGDYVIAKTARLAEKAEKAATEYKVFAGHHFAVGDKVSADGSKVVGTINKIENKGYGVQAITLDKTLDVAIDAGGGIYQCEDSKATEPLITPIAVVGERQHIDKKGSLWCSAWVIGVVVAPAAPFVPNVMRQHLKSVVFI